MIDGNPNSHADDLHHRRPVINVGNILGTRTDDSTAVNADGSDEGVHHYGRDTNRPRFYCYTGCRVRR